MRVEGIAQVAVAFDGFFYEFLIRIDIFNVLRVAVKFTFADENVVAKDLEMGEQKMEFAEGQFPINIIAVALHCSFEIATEICNNGFKIGSGNAHAVKSGDVETPIFFESSFDEMRGRFRDAKVRTDCFHEEIDSPFPFVKRSRGFFFDIRFAIVNGGHVIVPAMWSDFFWVVRH